MGVPEHGGAPFPLLVRPMNVEVRGDEVGAGEHASIKEQQHRCRGQPGAEVAGGGGPHALVRLEHVPQPEPARE